MSGYHTTSAMTFSVDAAVGAAKLDALAATIDPITQAVAAAPATLRARLQARLQSVRDEPELYQQLLMVYQALLERAEVAARHADSCLTELRDVLPRLAAPWPVQQLGQQAVDGLVPRASALAGGITTEQLASASSWRGPGASEFAAAMAHQVRAGDAAAEATGLFSQTLLDYGERAVADVEAFLTTAAGQLAIIAESAGPLATVSGAAGAAARIVQAGDALGTAVTAITQTATEQSGLAGQSLTSDAQAPGGWPSVRSR